MVLLIVDGSSDGVQKRDNCIAFWPSVLDLYNFADTICHLIFPPLLKLLGYRVKLVNALNKELDSL